MQVNLAFHSKQKYKVLVFLHLTLFFLYGYFVKEIFIYGTILYLILFLGILYFLIKLYKNENTLIEFAQVKSRVLTNMSHEIRTPLNSVIGFSEQLGQSKLNNKQAEQLHAIRSSSILLLDLVNNILDFSKYETSGANFDKMPFNPLEAIDEVVKAIAILAIQKDIELKSNISFKDNVCFSGDSLRLKQVVMNLLSNAIKFTEQGSVTLKADIGFVSKKQCVLTIDVIDTGIGISAKNLVMIFDEYAQVNYSSTQVKHKGTGLGLAICKRIVEIQEGEIMVNSELGKGSIFSFSIPYQICNEKASEIRDSKAIALSSLIGKRILLADDNKMNVLLVQTVIAKYKMLFDVAYDGEEAFEFFKRNRYDLVLTDIQMPKMNGVELSKKIRSYHSMVKQKTPILGVTASVLSEDRNVCINAGMNDLVLKPFSENELIEKIANQLT